MPAELVYADASALVKLVLEEPESAILARAVTGLGALVTSRLSAVEVTRAVRLEAPGLVPESDRLLRSCVRVAVLDEVVDRARRLAGERLRTLDALHLATALHAGARTVLAYDRRLLDAAAAEGLRVLSPA